MPRRTRTFPVSPWVGGVNTSVDPGMLNPQELVKADNVVFSATGARIKREALEYIDPAVPAPVYRSSSGTTRTLKFAADALVTTSPANQKLVVGERITVSGVSNYNATDVEVLTVTDTGGGVYTITYTGGSSLTEAETAAGGITIARASRVIAIHDYWRYASDDADTQLLVYATDDFQLFYLDGSGRRVQILGQGLVQTIQCLDAASITTGDYFYINSANDETEYYVWYNKASGGGDPAPAGKTAIPVAIGGGDTAAQVASATQAAIDALADFSASVNIATVTVTNAAAGITTAASDANSGFTFAVTTYGATDPTSALSTVRFLTFNENLLIFFSGLDNTPCTWNPDTNAKYQLISGAPDASFGRVHLGRVWCNDKTNKGRLHYSETFDESKWLGIGDSGAVDAYPGDGDPAGILNAYVYKGMLVVGKKAKRYRILGDSPENFYVELISDGMGNEGDLAIAVDETDVIFISRRGIHSQAATDTYGDTDSAYLSSDIKPTFNEWEADELRYTQGTYIPELNSIALSVAEEGQSDQNAVWLYNFEVQVPGKSRPGVWYRWPDISCPALSRQFHNDQYRLVFGTADGRLIRAQKPNDYADFGTDGIAFNIKTGTIYPGSDIQGMKAFKKLTMIYRPKGNFTFVVKATIDNHQAQFFGFNQISGQDLLGDTFTLGNSTLGSSATLAPFTWTMEGFGRGVTLEITQPSADEQVEIWGFIIEYEPADLQQANDNEAGSSDE